MRSLTSDSQAAGAGEGAQRMSNAAIMIHPDAYDTQAPRLMGRQSAGEGFLRGLLRHADVDRFHLWNFARQPTAALERLISQIESPPRPVRWLSMRPELQ